MGRPWGVVAMASIDASLADPAPVLKILFVDDNEVHCSSAVKMLGKYGHEVITAPSAEEAMLLLGQHAFDLAVVDWMLPGGADGLFLTSRICHEHPEVPVIVISGESSELGTDAEKSGARRFLPKPFSGKELNAVCLEVVAEVRAEAEDEPVEREFGPDEEKARCAAEVAESFSFREAVLEEVKRGTDFCAAEERVIRAALDRNRWHVGNTARGLGVSRPTLWRRMKKYVIER